MVDDEKLKEGRWANQDLEDVERVVWSLLSLCSTYLTVVSPDLETTRREIVRLVGLVQPLVGNRKGRNDAREKAVLDWRWVGQDIADQDQDQDLDGNEGDGRAVLESVLEGYDDIEERDSRQVLDTVCKVFDGVKCKPPTPVGVEWSRRGSEVDAIRAEAATGTFRILCDYSIDDNKAEKRFQWIRKLWRSFDGCGSGIEDCEAEYPRVFSGAILSSRIQACLAQLKKHSRSSPHHPPLLLQQQFNTKELQTTLQDLIRERALSIGMRTYHREMNMFLNKRPIPLPWHTLAMVHLRAQSIACEEIEARFWGAGGGGLELRRVMKEFRRPCVVTEADEDRGMVVPGGGLYLEYYSANAAALQEHHLSALDEHWQVLLKNRLLVAKNGVGGSNGSTGAAAVGGSGSGLSKAAPHIKDYTEFLLAVDQVRRGYLESCIPSPEALSVLENLDEMQQSESILFLKTLAAAAPSADTSATATANTTVTNAQQQHQPPQQQPASAKGLPSKRYSITNHPTVALNGRELMIHPAAGDDSRINNTGGGNMSSARRSSSSQAVEAPTELEQQIADILMSKRGRHNSQNDSALAPSGQSSRKSTDSNRSSSRGARRSAMSLFQDSSNGAGVGQTAASKSIGSLRRKSEDRDKTVVQFGWTFHLRHANSLQYAWIWDWLSSHAGSSHQNVVACDNKIYTASKWMILPARDTVVARTKTGRQKEWKIAYGDRIWLVSYWYSTRNATMELPEYLPRARGGACRHVVPYGETFIICRTCPADVLCMRCFRASDHADHSMYLQCSWGDSVCVCGDPAGLKEDDHGHGLHCSMHSAEPERAYSGLAKGGPCGVLFLPGETIYKCKSCLINEVNDKALCVRCFHSQNHFEHDVVVQLAEAGTSCSCEDGYSWRDDLTCSYHSPGNLEVEYLPKAISPITNCAVKESDNSLPTTAAVAATQEDQHQCEHVFQQGEDIYHCQDCSAHEGVALCSRCFFASDCVTHQWRVGQFWSGAQSNKRGSTGGSVDDTLASVVDGLGIRQGALGSSTNSMHPLEQRQQEEAEDEEDIVVRCGCGDPGLFRKAFDCNYHLPQEFRPVPQSHHCNYLFQREEVMFQCHTCHVYRKNDDVWICGRCFDPMQHVGHETEEVVNHWNEGLYCRCGDPSIFQEQPVSEGLVVGAESKCRDDHNRQTVLCATDIKDGMFFYRCQHERVGGTNVVLKCKYFARAGEWVSFCSDCYPSEEGTEGVRGYLCRRCRESSDHSGHEDEWVQLEEDMILSCACGSRRQTLPLGEEEDGEQMAVIGQSPSSPPALCGYHTMVYKTTPSTTLFLHSSRDHQPSNHHHDDEDRSEVSGCKYDDSDNDWVLHRSPSYTSSTKHEETGRQLLRWKDMVWLEHANTGRYFSSMAGYKNGQGFQEVVCADEMDEEDGDGDHEWIVEETTWVRQHILGQ
ncbi:hypothetical protein BG015_011792 [Linnemannia schmuckeri]|uniref:E3 ubiquitin-protein ligase n=1 Tax=Linnemannia schmuckeri TaxID=64567 RepID=A0A9P5RSI8_9FUNG|nr:hypothetical protein BG015_011792 [Linnemannia schmuckeri]